MKDKLLLATYSKGNTSCQKTTCLDNLDLFHKIINWANDNLTAELIKTILLLDTGTDRNPACYKAEFWGKLDVLQKIWDLASVSVTTEELNLKRY
jgi:hypothetical protein